LVPEVLVERVVHPALVIVEVMVQPTLIASSITYFSALGGGGAGDGQVMATYFIAALHSPEIKLMGDGSSLDSGVVDTTMPLLSGSGGYGACLASVPAQNGMRIMLEVSLGEWSAAINTLPLLAPSPAPPPPRAEKIGN